jgi:hypothetical protein
MGIGKTCNPKRVRPRMNATALERRPGTYEDSGVSRVMLAQVLRQRERSTMSASVRDRRPGLKARAMWTKPTEGG